MSPEFNARSYQPKLCGDCEYYTAELERYRPVRGIGRCGRLDRQVVRRSDFCRMPEEERRHAMAIDAYIIRNRRRN